MHACRAFLVAFLTIPLLAVHPPPAGAQQKPAPYRIGRIIVVRHEVFDRRRDGWFGGFANSLHALTREEIVRNELLFQEGDIYNPDLIEESERNLRAMGIIGDVTMDVDTVRNRRVNVRVYTRDRWTLGLNTTFKKEGGITKMALAIQDDNLLGNAQKVSLGYNYQSDRNRPHGTDISFIEPRLLGTRFAAKLGYRHSDDASLRTLHLERRFYAEETPWAGGLYLDHGRIRVKRYEEGNLVFDDYLVQQNQNAWAAHSFGYGRTRYRFGAGYVRVRQETGDVPTTSHDRLDLLTFSASVSRRDFYKGKFIENFGRVEDVALGYNFSILGGPNVRRRGASTPNAYARMNVQYVTGSNKTTYYAFATDLSGFFYTDGPRDATLETTLLYHWRVFPRATLVARLSHLKGFNWPSIRQLFLGSPDGLRGYETYEFSGQERVLLNVEYRMFPNINLWIFRFGGALFWDTGAVRETGRSLLGQRIHTAIGFGVRIENSAQQGAGLIRVDFPFNLDKRRFTEIIISADQLVRAFADIMYYSPNAVR